MYTVHEPVLLREVLQYLDPKKNQDFIDCTLGGGGHTEAILERTGPKGRVLGLDWDAGAVKRAAQRLSSYGSRTIFKHSNYINVKQVAYENKFHSISGILIDLGLSLDQLQNSGRGFSFQVDEPLDMRFSENNELTAAKVLNTYSEENLVKIFSAYGEERESKRIARAVVKERKEKPLESTLQLVHLVTNNKRRDRRRRIHPATQVFQALRIEVNNELNNVRLVLGDLIDLLDAEGRCAVITFHSIEDRIVKEYFKQESRGCLCPPDIPTCVCDHVARIKRITKKPVAPTDEEIQKNFRSRSAKLRVVEKRNV
jgi:16S rRNA (cytosine1402-N4)-methyltransferase